MIRYLPSLLLAAALSTFGQGANVNLSGIVTDSAGTPVSGATLKLENLGVTATSGADGTFTLSGSGVAVMGRHGTQLAPLAELRSGNLVISLPGPSRVSITAATPDGRRFPVLRRDMAYGSNAVPLAGLGTGLRFLEVEAGGLQTVIQAYALEGALHDMSAPGARASEPVTGSRAALAKPASSRAAAAAPLYDVLTATKAGFQKAYVAIANSDSANIRIKMLKEGAAKFSFFVTSMRTLQELAKDEKGFGGDFRFGETGAGAGLRGADKICATIAEKSMPGSSVKGWRAFLSVTADAYGRQVNAIDRVGPGPWYDRTGRLLAPTKADIMAPRPKNGDATIQNDLPNEWGIPNHRPDPAGEDEDNHHTVTGSDTTGRLKGPTNTCKDWTVNTGGTANGKPTCGFSWPRNLGGGGGFPGGGGGAFGGTHWMSTWDAAGCDAGIEIIQTGPGSPTATFIGSGGGYGGFYCFALNP